MVQCQRYDQQSCGDFNRTIALWSWIRRLRFVCNLRRVIGSALNGIYGYLGRSEWEQNYGMFQ